MDNSGGLFLSWGRCVAKREGVSMALIRPGSIVGQVSAE